MYESVPKGDAIMVKVRANSWHLNYFEPKPSYENVLSGYIYVLQATCHNWSDEKCVALLKNCYKALPQDGKVIILDMIMPQEPDSSDAAKYVSIVDNTMFIQAGGKERTLQEFEKLSKESGFSSFKVVCRALSVHGVVELYKWIPSVILIV